MSLSCLLDLHGTCREGSWSRWPSEPHDFKLRCLLNNVSEPMFGHHHATNGYPRTWILFPQGETKSSNASDRMYTEEPGQTQHCKIFLEFSSGAEREEGVPVRFLLLLIPSLTWRWFESTLQRDWNIETLQSLFDKDLFVFSLCTRPWVHLDGKNKHSPFPQSVHVNKCLQMMASTLKEKSLSGKLNSKP